MTSVMLPLLLIGPLAAPAPLPPAPASAAGEAPVEEAPLVADLGELSLEALMAIEIPTVSAVSKRSQRVTDAAGSVTIVTREEIRRYGWRTLADLLRSVRGFYVSNDRQYTYLGTRGFLRNGDYNSRILLLVNGHRVNDNVYDSVLAGSEGVMDPGLIERVEIVRGPGSSMYGASAFFAVVDLITRAPATMSGFRLEGGLGTQGTGEGGFSWGMTRPGGLEALLSATGAMIDGEDRYYRAFDDPATYNGVAKDIDRDEAYRFFGQYRSGRFSLDAAHSSRDKVVPTGAYGVVFGDPRNKSLDDRSWVLARQEVPLGRDWNLSGQLSWDRYAYHEEYVYDGTPQVVNRDETNGESWGFEVQGTGRLGPSHTLTSGIDFRDDYRQDQKNFDLSPSTSYVDSRQDGIVAAIYAEDEARLSPTFSITAGARYDHYTTFGGTLNPRAAMIWHPREDMALKILAGRAFRAPNVYELYYESSNGLQGANPDLQPETIKTAELAWDQFTGSRGRIAASVFYYRLDDLIALVADPSTGELFYRNFDAATSRGFELEAERRFAAGIEGGGSYAYADARDSGTGAWLTNAPRQLARARVSAPLAGERLRVSLGAEYTSRRLRIDGGEAGRYALVNLTLLSRDLAPGLEIQLDVANLLDRDYADPATEAHQQTVIDQDGRTARLTVAWRIP